MNRVSLTQLFTNAAFIPAKCTLSLRPVQITPSSPIVLSANDITIDAANIDTISGTTPYNTFFSDTGTTFTDSGFMSTTPTITETEEDLIVINGGGNIVVQAIGPATISYPIIGLDDGVYHVWFRVRPTTAQFGFSLKIDSQLANAYSTTIGGFAYSDTWMWVEVDIVLPDLEEHTLSITPTTGGYDLDKIYFTKSSNVPAGTGPATTAPTYSTAHVRVSNTAGGVNSLIPSTPLTYDAQSTYSKILHGDLYNFNTFGTVPHGTNCVVLNVSGASISKNIVWDAAGDYTLASGSSTNGAIWAMDYTTSLSLLLFSSAPSTGTQSGDTVVITPDAVVTTDVINDFTTTTNPTFFNTQIVADNVNDVVLDTDPKAITILVDQSGSNTWNDSENIRLNIVNDVVTTIEDRYPATVNYNLFTFGGQKSFSIFIPLTEQIASNNVSDIIRTSLLNDPSDFSGFRLLRKEGGYSETPIDGEIITDGYALAGLDVGLTTGSQYYYTLFTYDQYYRYSAGIQITATAFDRVLPRGIPSFAANVYKGFGPIIDPNVVAMWNMDEGSGNHIYDFSLTGLELNLANINWLDIQDSPVGLYGIRLNGNSSIVSSQPTTAMAFGATTNFTAIFTLFPLDTTTENTIVARSSSTQFGWGIDLIAGGNLRLRVGTSTIVSTAILPQSAWAAVGVSYNASIHQVTFYINGVTETHTFNPTSGVTSLLPMNIGEDPSGVFPNTLFGKITHVSIHNVVRDANYISSALDTNTGDRSDPASQTAMDNGDRVVALSWNIPDDFNFVGGQYRLLVNKVNPPQHENDGIILLQTAASAGSFTFNASDNYDCGHNYYFRLFSQNTEGNWSDVEDSAVLTVSIPSKPVPYPDGPGPGFGFTPTPIITNTRAGNAKVWLEWDLPYDVDTHRVVIYYGATSSPYYDGKTQEIIGDVIYDEPFEYKTSFVHRGLNNYQTAYYVIVTIDKYQRFSQLAYTNTVPLPQLDDSGIPLLEGLNVQYHTVDYDQIQITWDSPITLNNALSGYFDETVYLYGAICDLYGNPLDIDFPDNFVITPTVTGTQSTAVEDVFGLGTASASTASIPSASFSFNNGLITGKISLNNSALLSIIEQISIGVTGVYNYSTNFNYTLPTLALNFNNPIQLQLFNRDNILLDVSDFGQTCSVPQESGPPPDPLPPDETRTNINACYVRRQLPFAVRAVYTYKGLPISQPSLNAVICDDVTKDGINVNVCSAVPNIATSSTTVLFSSNGLTTQTEQLPILDDGGNDTGYTHTVSFSDLYVIPPYLPQTAIVFFEASFNGAIMVRKINLFFANILRISLTASAPNSDGLDIREEFAQVSLIDPNAPSDPTKITLVPDDTIVQWVLSGGSSTSGTTIVPFYSTDDVPLGNGIYSYTRNGTARDVFFGPASPSAAGEYKLTVSTTYEGLFANASAGLSIKGIGSSVYNGSFPDPTLPTILAELEDAVVSIYADGVEYIKMWIWRDPTTSTAIFKDCYLNCSTVIVPLRIGQTVHVEADGWDVIFGAQENVYDEYTGETTLDVSSALIGNGQLDIQMGKGPYTNVYFRQNKEIADSSCTTLGGHTNCGCPLPAQTCGQLTQVTVSSKINFNGQPVVIYGGGSLNGGRPPTILGALEPLQFNFIGVFVNGQPVNQIVIDGITENVIVGEILWRNAPVEDGTPAAVTVTTSANSLGQGLQDFIAIPTAVYSVAQNDPIINPTGSPRSFVKLKIPPITNKITFAAAIALSVTFNEVGSTPRLKQFAVEFSYYIEQPLVAGTPSSSITGSLQRYDLMSDVWTNLASMNNPRASFPLIYFEDHLFAVSGTDGAVLLNTVEKYSIGHDEWILKSGLIPTPRIYSQYAVSGQYIYMVGGFIANPDGSTGFTGAVERYDMVHDVWTVMAPLPTGYEIAFGIAACINNVIYVMSGYHGSMYTYNNNILAYNIASNSWSIKNTYSDAQSLDLLYRLDPFYFVNGNNIEVLGGLNYTPQQGTGADKTPPANIFLTDAYQFNVQTNTLSSGEHLYRQLPVAKFNGVSVSTPTLNYFIGGSNATNETLRYFETVSSTSSPFPYAALAKLSVGRNSFGGAAQIDTYGDAIFIAGGITSGIAPNYLQVTTEVVPANATLNGIETVGVNVYVQDEDGESPASVTVRLMGTGGNEAPTLFTKDNITVTNGFGIGTLLPRSDDPATAKMGEGGTLTSYSINITGSILDPQYFGDTLPMGTNNSSGGASDPNGGPPSVNINVTPTYIFPTVVQAAATGTAAVLNLSNIGGFIDLNPSQTFGGSSSNVTYTATHNWLPQIDAYIDDNEGAAGDVLGWLARIQKNVPFGGTPMLDALNSAATIMTLDATGYARKVFIASDGEENVSNATLASTVNTLNVVDGPENLPVVAAIEKVVPSTMHLDKGQRLPSGDLETIATETNGSTVYVTSDNGTNAYVANIFSSNGFIGDGTYDCVVDLGGLVLLQQIQPIFQLSDPDANAAWQFALAGEDQQYSEFTDLQAATTELELTDTVTRYIKFHAVLKASLNPSHNGVGVLVPPRLTKINIVYHKKTISYIYLTPKEVPAQVSQIIITVDAIKPFGSSIEVGFSSYGGFGFSDYFAPEQPTADTDDKIIVPLRVPLQAGAYSSLESLTSKDGFVFISTYGKWDTTALVAVYQNGTTVVDPSLYRAFPDQGYIVFTSRTSGNFVLSIENQPQLSVAVRVTNRVAGNPVAIHGVSYQYTTLEPTGLASGGSRVIPQALNVLLIPTQPTVSSIFTALYSYYDLSGAKESGTKILWYINNAEQDDLANLTSWDNSYFNLATAGSQIYFTLTPSNGTYNGITVRSLPVTVTG